MSFLSDAVPPVPERVEEETAWALEDIIPLRGLVFLSGVSEHGKSWVAMSMAEAISNGRPWCGLATLPCPVVYLDRENPQMTVLERTRKLAWPQGTDVRYWGRWLRPLWKDPVLGREVSLEPPGPDHQVVEEWVEEQVAEGFNPVLFFDTWIAFYDLAEESQLNDRRMGEAYRRLTDLGATVVILLHASEKTKTASKYRGNTELKAGVDMAYLVKKVPADAKKLERVDLVPWKGRVKPGREMTIYLKDGMGFSGASPKAMEVLELVRNHPGMGVREAARKGKKELGLGEMVCRRALDELVCQGVIFWGQKSDTPQGGKGRKGLYVVDSVGDRRE